MREFFEVLCDYPWTSVLLGIFILILIDTLKGIVTINIHKHGSKEK